MPKWYWRLYDFLVEVALVLFASANRSGMSRWSRRLGNAVGVSELVPCSCLDVTADDGQAALSAGLTGIRSYHTAAKIDPNAPQHEPRWHHRTMIVRRAGCGGQPRAGSSYPSAGGTAACRERGVRQPAETESRLDVTSIVGRAIVWTAAR